MGKHDPLTEGAWDLQLKLPTVMGWAQEQRPCRMVWEAVYSGEQPHINHRPQGSMEALRWTAAHSLIEKKKKTGEVSAGGNLSMS